MENGRIGLVVPGLADPLVQHNPTQDTHTARSPDRVNFSQGPKAGREPKRVFFECQLSRMIVLATLCPLALSALSSHHSFPCPSSWGGAYLYPTTALAACLCSPLACLLRSGARWCRIAAQCELALREHCSARASKLVHSLTSWRCLRPTSPPPKRRPVCLVPSVCARQSPSARRTVLRQCFGLPLTRSYQ